MEKRNLKFGVGMLISMVFIILTACGKKEETEQNTPDSMIVVLDPNSEPEGGFNPIYGWGAGEHVHEPLIQSTLTITTKDLQIDYDLATDMNVSEDGMSWTVTIREDAVFSDGEKLTAKDVAFTYNTAKENSSVNDFTMFDYAEAMDEKTVIFHMKKPYSIWPYTMAYIGIVPEHAYNTEYGQNPIGSGRYQLKQWDKGQQVILEANPNYYGEIPNIKKVTVLFMEEASAFAAILAGQVDLSYTTASYTEQSVDGYQLLAFPTVDNRGFNLPAIPETIGENGILLGNNFTCDVEVRRAINIGINRKEIIEHVLNGYGTEAYSVCDKMPWYQPSSVVDYNLEEAKTLLEEAGWKKNTDGIREKNGIRAEFTLLYPTEDSIRQALAAETKNQLKSLGIEVKVEGAGWDTAYDKAQSDALMWGWGSHTPMELYNIYHTKEGSNLCLYSPYSNKKVNEYMEQALASNDLEEAYELWKKAQWDKNTGITQQGDIPWIWLVNIDHLYWARDGLNVAEQKIHPHGHGWSILNNIDKWSFE